MKERSLREWQKGDIEKETGLKKSLSCLMVENGVSDSFVSLSRIWTAHISDPPLSLSLSFGTKTVTYYADPVKTA